MEMVDIVATSNFINSQIGSVSKKQRLRVPRPLADEFIRLKIAKLNPLMAVCKNKPHLTVPLDGGGGKLSVSLPVAPVSPKKTAILLQGAPTGVASQSTTLGSAPPKQMFSGPVMERGGESTTKKSHKNSKGKSGRKTTKVLSNLELTESVALMSPA
jgi:hypothetical protein